MISNKTVLVVGASGATGKQVVEQLLNLGNDVKIVVRSLEKLPAHWIDDNRLDITIASLLDLTDGDMIQLTKGCLAIISCLGHNLTLKGVYGQPRKLVTIAVGKLSRAVEFNKPADPIRFLLMNTTGNRNRDLDEPISLMQKCVVSLLRLLLPPHTDNEAAAEFLRTEIGQINQYIQWSVVRPDSLVDRSQVSEYEVFGSPIRSAIFNPGQTSRINVAHFMSRLACESGVWDRWRGQMPVLYNKSTSG